MTSQKTISVINKPLIKKRVKLFNFEILQLYRDLNDLQVVPGIKLNYAIHRTKAQLKPLVEAYAQDKLIPVLDNYKAFEKELQDAYKKMCRDKDGNLLTKVQSTERGEMESMDIDLNSPAVTEIRARIQTKFHNAIETRKEQIRQYNEWLREECSDDYQLFFISKTEMPDNADNTKQLWDAVSPLIKDLSPEQQKEWDELFAKY
jgi:hypothetical protein